MTFSRKKPPFALAYNTQTTENLGDCKVAQTIQNQLSFWSVCECKFVLSVPPNRTSVKNELSIIVQSHILDVRRAVTEQ